MAEHATSTPAPTMSDTRDDFDQALSQARIIADIISHLADAGISTTARPCASLYDWLGEELTDRLERIEVAAMTLRSGRA